MSQQRENRAQLEQIEKDEERGVRRRKQLGQDVFARGMTPMEQLAAAFVEQEIRSGRLKTDQEIRMHAAYGEALDYYHQQLEANFADGPNGSIVEVRDHMLPADVLTEVIDGEEKQVPLRVVTVTFPPSESQ